MVLVYHDGIEVPFLLVSTPYERSGRSEQKLRTRQALLTAARELVTAGVTPTVEEAAELASVSRTTAYRYFPNQRTLLVAAHPETVAASLLPEEPPPDAASRLDAVVRAFAELIVDTEPQQRTMLRLSLDPQPTDLPLRQGRAIGWFEEALDPLREQLSHQELHQLALAIRAAVGIEALVWLTDIAKLSRPEAVGLMRWSAQALLQAALTSPPPLP